MSTVDPSAQEPEGQPEGQSANWRQLEQSRDAATAKAEKATRALLKLTAEKHGFDPDKGVGKLLTESFVREHADLDPGELDDRFKTYFTEQGIEPPEGGAGGQAPPDQAAQLLEQQQGQGQGLRDIANPPQGSPRPLQEQIAEAEAAGDHAKAQELNFELATQQFVESARTSVASASPAPGRAG